MDWRKKLTDRRFKVRYYKLRLCKQGIESTHGPLDRPLGATNYRISSGEMICPSQVHFVLGPERSKR